MAADRPGPFENRALAQLTTAISAGDTAKALSLIRPDLPLDAVAKGQHQSPVFAAVDTGNVAVLEALLDAGASVSATNDMKETPLHAATARDHEAVVSLLLARGADVNAQIVRPNHQYHLRTPLMNAAMGNKLPLVKLLLEHGADPFLKDVSEMTALAFAEFGGKRTANHLRKVMAASPVASDLDLPDAARAGLIDRVRALLDGDGRFAAPVKDAERLAERMIAFCPDMVDQADYTMSSLSHPPADRGARVAADRVRLVRILVGLSRDCLVRERCVTSGGSNDG